MEEENKNINEENNINQENFLDENNKKSNSGIYIIAVILILLIAGVLLYKFIFNKDFDNNDGNNIDNVTISDDATHSDDVVTPSDDNVDSYVSVKEVKLRNHFLNKDAVVYNCKSTKCTIEDFKNGFMVYDNDSFYFKKISSSEYELLFGNNSNLTQPLILFMNNLGKIEPEKHMVLNYKYDGEVLENEFILYNLNDSFFVFSPYFDGEGYEIYPLFNEKEDEFNQVLDDLLVFNSYLIDWKNKKVIYDDNICPYGHIKKIGKFYITYEDGCMTGSTPNKIFTEEYNFINSLYEKDYYIKDDKIYYIDNNILKVIDSSNKLLNSYEDIKPINFYENELLYKDFENRLNIKDILNDKVIITYDIKTNGYNLGFEFYKVDGEYYVFLIGDYIYDDNAEFYKPIDIDSNFKKFISDNNLNFSMLDFFSDHPDGNVIAYRLKFDKNGNFVSGEFVDEEYW